MGRSGGRYALRGIAIRFALLVGLFVTCLPDSTGPGLGALDFVVPDTVFAVIGQTQTPSVQILVDDVPVAQASVSLVSEDNGVVVADSTGLLRAVGRGVTAVRVSLVTAAGGEGARDTTFTVLVRIAGMAVAPSDTTLTSLGDTTFFRPGYRDLNGTALAMADSAAIAPTYWLQENGVCDALSPGTGTAGNAISVVPATGALVATANGTDVVCAAVDTSSIPMTVTVEQRADSLKIDPGDATLTALTETVQFGDSAFDARGNVIETPVGPAAWVSDDTTVVTIDDAGVATAVREGTASLTRTVDATSAAVDVTVDQVPAAMVATGGDDQTGTAGEALPQPMTIQLQDALGHDVAEAGVRVFYEVIDGGGTLDGRNRLRVNTAADGSAATVLTLGTVAGDTNRVVVSSAGLDSLGFFAVPAAGAAAAIAIAGGDAQADTAAATLLQPLEVLVTDAHANPVAGIEVTFAASAGGLSATEATSDGAGIAATSWTLSTLAQGETVTAAATGLEGSPLTFNATVLPASIDVDVSTLAVSSATVAAGANVTLTLEGRDTHGNPVTTGGATVVFSHTGGGSAGAIGTTTDGGAGTYTATFSGTTAGTPTTIGATIDGSPVTTPGPTVSVTPGAIAADNSIVSVSTGTVPSGDAVTLTLQAKDLFDNDLTTGGSTVGFSIAGGTSTGTIAPDPATDPDDGTYTATFTGGSAGTAVTVNATIDAQAVTTPLPTITVTFGGAEHVHIIDQPSPTTAGEIMTPAVVAEIHDAAHNLVTTATNAVTVSFATNPAGANLFGTVTKSAVDGVATFDNLRVDRVAQGFELAATATNLNGATSDPFEITPAPVMQLVVTTAPTDAVAGAAIAPSVVVELQDDLGNTVATATNDVTVAIGNNPGGGTLSGTTTVSAVAGVATFADLSIEKVGAGYTLDATATLLTGATTPAFAITPAAAARLAFSTEPTNVTSAEPIAPAVEVSVLDGFDNLVTSSTATVDLIIGTNPAGGTLSGTVSVAAVAGVATFADLSVDRAGAGYTLDAASGGGALTGTGSATFTVIPGAASALAFTAEPSDATAGSDVGAVTVEIQDAQGNLVTAATNAITMTIGTNPGGATLFGTLARAAVGGVATFSDLFLDKTGVGYALGANATLLTGATSATFDITPDVATQLAFTAQPGSGTAGIALNPAVDVAVLDQFGNTVTSASDQVSIGLGTDPTGVANLTGTSPVAANNGIASFTDLSIDQSGSGFTLTAAAPGLTGATSAAFDLSASSATQLAFIAQPIDVTAGATMNAVTVQIRDGNGNPVTTATDAVTLAITGGTGTALANLTGGGPVAAVNGLATFNALSVDSAGAGYTLTASAAGLTNGVSGAFAVNPGAAAQLAFTVEPSNTSATQAIAPAIEVTVRDALGNTATSATNLITLAFNANPGGSVLLGTTARNAAAGVAVFDDISLDKAGTGYALDASAGGLTGATSASFDISASATVSASMSTADANPTANVVADGVQTSTVTVTVLDPTANPIAGQIVQLAATGAGNTITQPAAVTDAAGQATGTIASTVAEGKTITVTVNPGGGQTVLTTQPTVDFIADAGNIDVGSAVGVFPASVIADGIQTSTATITVVDGNGNPVSGQTVQLAASGTGNTITQPAAATDVNGGATGTIASTVAEMKTITATVDPGGAAIVLTTQPVVDFTVDPGTVSATNTTVGVNPASVAADGVATSTITVTVRDATNNPVAGQTVSLAATGSGNVLTQPGAVTDGAGVATGTLASTGTGTKTITATINPGAGQIVAASQPTIDFTAGVPAKLAFAVEPTNGVAGATLSAVQVSILDANDNVVTTSGASITLAFDTDPSGGDATLGGTVTVAAVSGVATFGDLTVDVAEVGYTLRATSTGLADAVSAAFDVTHAAAAQLLFTQEPTDVAAGAAIAPAVAVTVADAFGNPVTSVVNAVTLAIGTNPGGATLSGATTVNTTNGVATFSNLNLDVVGVGYTLLATSGGLPAQGSATFDVTAGAPAALMFTVAPSNATAGVAIAPAIEVTVVDAGGNPVTTAIDMITLAIENDPGGGTLSGTATVAAVNGVATFSDISIDKVGVGYTLRATATGLTDDVSAGFDITVAAAAQLTFGVEPTDIAAGAVFNPVVEVRVEDQFGNLVPTATNQVTLAFGTDPTAGAATLLGTPAQNAVNGVATFGDLSVDVAATGYTLDASATLLTGSTSATFDVTVGAAAQLAFVVEPTDIAAGASIAPAVQVEVQDAAGNLVTGATNAVTLTIGTNPSGGALFGTTVKSAIGGVATFGDLTVDAAGVGYALAANGTGLTGAASAAFDVTPSGVTKLSFLVEPSDGTAGVAMAPAIQVELLDNFQNRVSDATDAVTLSIRNDPSGAASLTGTTTVSAVSGVATFDNVRVDSAAVGFTLEATSGGIEPDTSVAFTIDPGTPTQLGFLVDVTSATAGQPIAPALQVAFQDDQGNTVDTETSNVTIAFATDPSGGTATLSGATLVPAMSGIATFNDLSIDSALTGYVLSATSGALTPATTASFDVDPDVPDHLVFTVEPTSTNVSTVIAPAVQVVIRDLLGNRVTTATDAVTIAIDNNPGGGTLIGTTILNAVGGVATFSDLNIDAAGVGYTLAVTSGSLTAATSGSFDISSAVPTMKTWGGGASTDWADPSNWSPAAKPTAADSVVVPAAAGQFPVLSQNETIATITVETGATVDVASFTLTVTGDVDAGNTITGSGTVAVTGTAVNVSGTMPNFTIDAAATVTLDGMTAVNGNATVNGTLTMAGQTMTVTGDFTVPFLTFGALIMQNAADSLDVSGNMSFRGASHTGLLTAGTIVARGDFNHQNGNNNLFDTFAASGTHKTVIAGTTAQLVTFDSFGFGNAFFHDLEIANTSPDSVRINRAYATGDVSVTTPGVVGGGEFIIDGDLTTVGGSTFRPTPVAIGGPAGTSNVSGAFDVQTLTFSGPGPAVQVAQAGLGYTSIIVNGPATLPDDLSISGDLALNAATTIGGTTLDVGGDFDFNAVSTIPGTLTVGGDFDMGGLAGTYTLSGPSSIGGDAFIRDTLVMGGQTLSVDGNLTLPFATFGALIMQNSADSLDVDGFVSFRGASSAGLLTAGVIVTRATFTQQRGNNNVLDTFAASGTHRTVLDGTTVQTVTFDGLGFGASFFNDLEIRNPTTDSVRLSSAYVAGDLTVSTPILVEANSPNLVVDGDLTTVAGSTIRFDFLDLGGPLGTTAVNGSFDVTILTFTGPGPAVQVAQAGLGYTDIIVNGPATLPADLSLPGDLALNAATTIGGSTLAVGGDFDLHAVSTIPGILTVGGDFTMGGLAGTYTLTGPSSVGGDALISDTLVLGGQTLSVGGNFTLPFASFGALIMQNAADSLDVSGDMSFRGASHPGILTDGVIVARGDFTQQRGNNNVLDTFAASGAHRVVLESATAQTISFDGLGFGSSFFHDLEIRSNATVTVVQGAIANGQLRVAPAFSPTFTGGVPLTAAGVDVDGVTFSDVPVTLGEGTITQFDNVTFQSFANTAIQLAVTRASDTLTFNNLTFTTLTGGATGFYVDATDTNTGDGQPLVVKLSNSNPTDGNAFSQANNASVIWNDIVVAEVVVTPAGATVEAGLNQTFTAEARNDLGAPIGGKAFTWTSLNPSLGTIGSGSGDATGVASGQVVVQAEVDGVSGFGVLTVTESGLSAPNLWSTVDLGTSVSLRGVWGANENAIVAVGDPAPGVAPALLARFDGVTWNIDSPDGLTNNEEFRDVWGWSPTDVFAVGGGGGTNNTIQRFDGATWTETDGNVFGQLLHAVWGPSPFEAYALGNGPGRAWDGQAWTTSGFGGNGIWGTAADDIFLVGDNGAIDHWNGTQIVSQNSGVSAVLTAVWGTSPTDVFVGGDGVILHYDGMNWSTQFTGAKHYDPIWGRAPDDVFAFAQGELLHYDGISWTTQTHFSGVTGLWGISDTDLIASGTNGLLAVGHHNATLTATPPAPTITSLGGTVQLTAEPRDEGNNLLTDVAVTWTSLDQAIAVVDANGLVTAVADGTVGIVVEEPFGGAADTATITVDQTVATVMVTPNGANFTVGGGASSITANAFDGLGNPMSGLTFNFATLNSTVAGVTNTSGNTADVVPFAAGQAVIEAEVDGVTGHTVATVTETGILPVGNWVPTANGFTTGDAQAIWGVSDNAIFAVSEGGEIELYNGTNWTTMTSATGNDLFGVWGTSTSAVFAVGSGGVIVHYNGTNWSTMSSPTGVSLRGVWAASPNDVFAVGNGGTIVHYDGSTWASQTSGTGVILRDVWGTAGDNVFAVGDDGTILRYNGTAWSTMTSGVPMGTALEGIGGVADDDILAVGGGGTIIRFNGASWSAETSNTTRELLDVWGSSSSDLYAVGDAGTVQRYNGMVWQSQPSGTESTIRGIWGTSSPMSVYAVGSDQTTLTGTRGVATVTVTPNGVFLNAAGIGPTLSAQAADADGNPLSPTITWTSLNANVATVDGGGTVTAVSTGQVSIQAEGDGVKGYALLTVSVPADGPVVQWTAESGIPSEDYFDVWAASPDTIIAVGTNRTILRFDGTNWNTESVSGPLDRFNSVWGTSSSDIFVVGNQGTIQHFDGTTWSAMSSGTSDGLNAVWGSAPDDVFAGGQSGTILHYDGVSWQPVTSPTNQIVNDFWGAASDDALGMANTGVVLAFDGNAWTIDDNLSVQVSDVRGFTTSNAYATFSAASGFGDGGVLQFDGMTWTEVFTENLTIDAMTGIWPASPSDVYAVGTNDPMEILHFNGTEWDSTDTADRMQAIYGIPEPNGDLIAVGLNGQILRGTRSAGALQVSPSGATASLIPQTFAVSRQDVEGNPLPLGTVNWSSMNTGIATVTPKSGLSTDASPLASGQVVITAESGGVFGYAILTVDISPSERVPLSNWTADNGTGSNNYDAVWGSSPTDVFAVGASSTIRRNTSGTAGDWSSMSNPGGNYNGVFGLADTLVFAVANSAEAHRFDGSTWTDISPSGESAQWNGIWAAAPNDVFVASEDGVWRYDGLAWRRDTTTNDQMFAIWGAAADDVFAVGENGTALHYDGTGWSVMTGTGSSNLNGVWGTSGSNVIAVGNNGTILRYPGFEPWSPEASGTSSDFLGVGGSAPDDIYAVGQGMGATDVLIARYDGTMWSSDEDINLGTGELRGVWATSFHDVIAVGQSGLIARGTRGPTCSGTGTNHSGTIGFDETWTNAAGPHFLTSDVTVNNSATLTIEAGALVCGQNDATLEFTGGGRLVARGTAAEPVTFAPDEGDTWGGLTFSGSPADTSFLTNARVLSADDGGRSAGSQFGILVGIGHQFAADTLFIDNSLAAEGAIELTGGAWRVENIVVTNAAGDGIVLQNPFGSKVLSRCDVSGSADDGIQVESGSNLTITMCNFENNGGDGIDNMSGNTVDAINNWWGHPSGPAFGDGVSGSVTTFPVLSAPLIIP